MMSGSTKAAFLLACSGSKYKAFIVHTDSWELDVHTDTQHPLSLSVEPAAHMPLPCSRPPSHGYFSLPLSDTYSLL